MKREVESGVNGEREDQVGTTMEWGGKWQGEAENIKKGEEMWPE